MSAAGVAGPGQGADLGLCLSQGIAVGSQGGCLLGQSSGGLGTGHDGGDGGILVLPAHAEGALAGLELFTDGSSLLAGLAGPDGVCSVRQLGPQPAAAGVRDVGLSGADGLVDADLDGELEGLDKIVAFVDEGEVGLGKVSGVTGFVDTDLAVKQGLGQVLELHGALVAVSSAARHVSLIAATNVYKFESNRGKGSLLACLVASGAVLLLHPGFLLLEVGHHVLPELHVEDGSLKTSRVG